MHVPIRTEWYFAAIDHMWPRLQARMPEMNSFPAVRTPRQVWGSKVEPPNLRQRCVTVEYMSFTCWHNSKIQCLLQTNLLKYAFIVSFITNNSFNIWLRHLNTDFLYNIFFFFFFFNGIILFTSCKPHMKHLIENVTLCSSKQFNSLKAMSGWIEK